MDWFKIGKGVHQGCILSHCLFNLCAEYIILNAKLDEAQAGVKQRPRLLSGFLSRQGEMGWKFLGYPHRNGGLQVIK